LPRSLLPSTTNVAIGLDIGGEPGNDGDNKSLFSALDYDSDGGSVTPSRAGLIGTSVVVFMVTSIDLCLVPLSFIQVIVKILNI
jgi:hypothetical protein